MAEDIQQNGPSVQNWIVTWTSLQRWGKRIAEERDVGRMEERKQGEWRRSGRRRRRRRKCREETHRMERVFVIRPMNLHIPIAANPEVLYLIGWNLAAQGSLVSLVLGPVN
jgi:hypothetical protein